ncbi:serine hydrolase domain-containing protein [Anatilimnocola sp. NA78]|uniref:serine hydrolase domain-containing protein n=1 Tax=Anatilimnocola sp. NA78 TaxID=3415683 RepID=UPI003CE49333
MNRLLLPGLCLGLITVTLGGTASAQHKDTAKLLESLRKQHELPALAAVVIYDGKVVDRGAVGVRKTGDEAPVTIDDAFHIGSCTKSMTATLAGILIDEGKIKWESTIAEVLPEFKGKMNKEYEVVTLEQLLQNRGGFPTDPPAAAWERAWKEVGSVANQRREFIAAALQQTPAAKPGAEMIYSNQGYTIAAAMLEKVEGKPWETIIAERIFRPLPMKSAGFGPPGKRGKVEQPWGHTREQNKSTPIQLDNPPAISPAGRVHCNMDDFARYVQLHLGSKEVPQLLKPETLRRLHTPPNGGDYACGWIVVERPWAGGKALMHNGSNNMWFAVMWLAPDRKFAVIAATNTAGEPAEKSCDEVAAAMIQKWLK